MWNEECIQSMCCLFVVVVVVAIVAMDPNAPAPGQLLRRDPAHRGLCVVSIAFLLPLAVDLVLAVLAQQSELALLQLSLGLAIVFMGLAIWCSGTHSFYHVLYLLIVLMASLQLILLVVKAFVLVFTCTSHSGCLASALFYGLSMFGNLGVFIALVILYNLALYSSKEEEVILSNGEASRAKSIQQLQTPDEAETAISAANALYRSEMVGTSGDDIEFEHRRLQDEIDDTNRDIAAQAEAQLRQRRGGARPS